MTVAIDTSVLLYILNENTSAPIDPATNAPVTQCRARVDGLIERLSKANEKVIVPTPVLAEVLVRAEAAGPAYLQIVERNKSLRLADFNALAAVEAAAMMSAVWAQRKPAGGDARSKIKFDIMIAAIARVAGASTVYSDDPDIVRLGSTFGFQVTGVAALPPPPPITPDLFTDPGTAT